MGAFNTLFIEDIQEDLKQCLLSAKHQYNQHRDKQIGNLYNDDDVVLLAKVTSDTQSLFTDNSFENGKVRR
jgi:hypothetical protein